VPYFVPCGTVHPPWQPSKSVADTSRSCPFMEHDGRGLVKALFAKLDEEEIIEVMTLAMLLWLRRNSFVFDKECISPAQLVHNAKASVNNFTWVVHRPVRDDSGREAHLQRWQ
jgi:hypothetical protein